MHADVAGTGERLKQAAPLLLLGVALAVAAVLLLSLTSGQTFLQDTWAFLMDRRGFTADAFLEPHNEHIVVIPVAIEQLLIRVFGMTSALPEHVVLTALLLGTATLMFVYVRRRTGPWPALMAAVLLLFLGPAWQDLLWPFEVGLVGSVLTGIAVLLALDRGDRRWDLAACGFLTLSVGFSSLGLAFAVGAAVDVLQRRGDRGLGRAYVVAVPLLLYGAWYVGWGHAAEGHLSLHNALVSPRFLLESVSSSTDSLLGLSAIAGEANGQSKWGIPLLGALVALTVYGQVRRPGVSPRTWPVVAAAATFWLLAALNYFPGREAYSSRYLYVGGAFVLLIAANLLKGVRFSRVALVAGGAVTVVAAVVNLGPLRDGRDWLESQSVLARADLGAIEIARRSVDPALVLTPEIAGTPYLINVRAGEYLQAVDEYGSPAYTPAELTGAPEGGRVQGDVVLAHALPVSTEIRPGAGGAAGRSGRCVDVPAGAGPDAAPLRLSPGLTRIELAPGGPATIRLRRFARDNYPLVTEGISGDTTTLLRIPADGASHPWYLQVDAAQPAAVCR